MFSEQYHPLGAILDTRHHQIIQRVIADQCGDGDFFGGSGSPQSSLCLLDGVPRPKRMVHERVAANILEAVNAVAQ
jgi:hypothetical protein